jgi:hypothetical protein
LQQLQVH